MSNSRNHSSIYLNNNNINSKNNTSDLPSMYLIPSLNYLITKPSSKNSNNYLNDSSMSSFPLLANKLNNNNNKNEIVTFENNLISKKALFNDSINKNKNNNLINTDKKLNNFNNKSKSSSFQLINSIKHPDENFNYQLYDLDKKIKSKKYGGWFKIDAAFLNIFHSDRKQKQLKQYLISDINSNNNNKMLFNNTNRRTSTINNNNNNALVANSLINLNGRAMKKSNSLDCVCGLRDMRNVKIAEIIVETARKNSNSNIYSRHHSYVNKEMHVKNISKNNRKSILVQKLFPGFKSKTSKTNDTNEDLNAIKETIKKRNKSDPIGSVSESNSISANRLVRSFRHTIQSSLLKLKTNNRNSQETKKCKKPPQDTSNEDCDKRRASSNHLQHSAYYSVSTESLNRFIRAQRIARENHVKNRLKNRIFYSDYDKRNNSYIEKEESVSVDENSKEISSASVATITFNSQAKKSFVMQLFNKRMNKFNKKSMSVDDANMVDSDQELSSRSGSISSKLYNKNIISKSAKFKRFAANNDSSSINRAGFVDLRSYEEKKFEINDKTLDLFLNNSRYSTRRNAVCSRIDKFYYNRELVNFMEFLLREDYIRNFLL